MEGVDQKRVRNLPPPPPLSAANFGRRHRTRSLTRLSSISSSIISIISIFSVDADAPHFNSRRDSVPGTPLSSTYKHETPFTGLLGRTLSSIFVEKMNE